MLTNYVKIAIAAYGGTKAMHERKNSMRECMLLFYETIFAARSPEGPTTTTDTDGISATVH